MGSVGLHWYLLPSSFFSVLVFLFLFPFCVLRIKPRALHMLDKHSTTVMHPQLILVFFDLHT
jgi:hypothetical protein